MATWTFNRRHNAGAYRSGLEEKIAASLKAALGRDVPYERYTIDYVVPSRRARYTPDFVLPNGVIIETKGRFLTEDRQKHLLVRDLHPELDIRFVFTNSKTRLYKGSPTSYADWCNKHGFKFADRHVPDEWLNEEPDPDRYEATKTILTPKGEGTS